MAWTDKLMLGSMISAESVAVYGVAFRFSMAVSITLMAVNSISSPKFAEKFANNDIHGMGKIAMQSAKMIFWTTLPLAFIVLSFPSFFMGLYGSDFTIGIEACLRRTNECIDLCSDCASLARMKAKIVHCVH